MSPTILDETNLSHSNKIKKEVRLNFVQSHLLNKHGIGPKICPITFNVGQETSP